MQIGNRPFSTIFIYVLWKYRRNRHCHNSSHKRSACKILYKTIKNHNKSIKRKQKSHNTTEYVRLYNEDERKYLFLQLNTILPKAITNNHIVIILLAECVFSSIELEVKRIRKKMNGNKKQASRRFISSVRSHLALTFLYVLKRESEEEEKNKSLEQRLLAKIHRTVDAKSRGIHKIVNYSSVQRYFGIDSLLFHSSNRRKTFHTIECIGIE